MSEQHCSLIQNNLLPITRDTAKRSRALYLPRGVIRLPSFQVSRIHSREQASALQVAQLQVGLGFRSNHLVEGVIESHRVAVSTLVLGNKHMIRRSEHRTLPFPSQCARSPLLSAALGQHKHTPVLL